MIVINRFRQSVLTPPVEDAQMQASLHQALAALSRQKGFLDGQVGRNVDDPDLWLLSTRWLGPGAYRRALSAFEVKIEAWATLGMSLDEPSAYEVLDGQEANQAMPRVVGATAKTGEA